MRTIGSGARAGLQHPRTDRQGRVMDLRPYQDDVKSRVRSRHRRGPASRIMLVAPTGSGKTVIAGAIIKSEQSTSGQGVLVLAHRREIITQTSEKLHDHGIPHGIIKAGIYVATAGAGAGRQRFKHCIARAIRAETHGAAAGRFAGDRRGAPLPGRHLSARSSTPIRTRSCSA